MLVKRRLGLHVRGDSMRCFGRVIVPVSMHCTSTVPVHMDVSREHGDAAQRCVQRVMRDLQFAVVVVCAIMIVVMTVIMLGERGPVGMGVPAIPDDDRNVEAVRLGNLIDELPVGSMIGKQKVLTCAIRAQGLDHDRDHPGAGSRP